MEAKRKICVVMVGYLKNTPPALSLIQALAESGHELTVISAKKNGEEFSYPGYDFRNVTFLNVIGEYEPDISLPAKLSRLFGIRKRIWDVLNSEAYRDALIIAISEITIKHMGERIVERDYIYYQLELIKEVSMIPHSPFFKIDIAKIARNAKKVIVCEYNRAHITKAWWGLETLPEVIPNKPYVPYHDNAAMPDDGLQKLQTVKEFARGRKIVLYQGIVNKQRPLEPFIEAVGLKKDQYCFVVVSSSCCRIDGSEDYLINIPFVVPPYHMSITEAADIGIMVYSPGGRSSYSELNPVFCAPNKIWEYARFGIPMVANDVPSLRYELDQNSMGICVKDLIPEHILGAYEEICGNYQTFSMNAKAYYASYDISAEINRVVDSVL